jgi:cytochrome c-type biogenesis protein CcmH
VFENALALEPNHPEALFWGGISASNSGNTSLAADRWELLLGTNPPEQIRGVLQARIAEWRGEPPPVATAAAPVAVIVADVSLSADAKAALPLDATVFIIARDPAQPSPPIAVTRRLLSELPFAVELGDRESMVPGRNLSSFAEFELIARVSVSAEPTAKTGDWFGSMLVRPAEGKQVTLSISEQVQ